MEFAETRLKGAYIVDLNRREDDRGFFARTFCQQEFEAIGIKPMIAQSNVAFNRLKGTVRGMHFQYPPASDSKLVRCTRGAIVDVIVDLRPESETYLECIDVELTERNYRALYVPERFAHGYQVLCNDTVVAYDAGQVYTPNAESGVRFTDPRLAIEWALTPTLVSEKDRNWPLLERIEPELRQKMTQLALCHPKIADCIASKSGVD
ncbi:MAG: dTDP-4-dehydrorhamnose 3,5-epimerase [Terriglobales bacterium]